MSVSFSFDRWSGVLPAAVVSLVCCNCAAPASADERVYDIVTDQSSIGISGTLNSDAGSVPIEQQGPGGLTTSYTGTLRADRGGDTIQFLAGGAIDANESGNWQPLANGDAGTAPANYGGTACVLEVFVCLTRANFAARNLLGDMTSNRLAVDESGAFSLASSSVNFIGGDMAFRTSGLVVEFGAGSIAGTSGTLGGTGSLAAEATPAGLQETLTIPVDSTFLIPVTESESVTLTLTGQLLATSFVPATTPGDYNGDGAVTAADYTVYRNHLGQAYQLLNEDPDNIDGMVTLADYAFWKSRYGDSISGTGASLAGGTANVPEPENMAPLLMAALLLAAAGRKR